MFCKIINNKIVEASSFFGEREFELSYKEFSSKPDSFYIYDEISDNIIQNPNFYTEMNLELKKEQKENLQKQLEELDRKRIRAICEPEIKNSETGETWLDFYNAQISDIRNQVMAL